jgi:hypothetical protein
MQTDWAHPYVTMRYLHIRIAPMLHHLCITPWSGWATQSRSTFLVCAERLLGAFSGPYWPLDP